MRVRRAFGKNALPLGRKGDQPLPLPDRARGQPPCAARQTDERSALRPAKPRDPPHRPPRGVCVRGALRRLCAARRRREASHRVRRRAGRAPHPAQNGAGKAHARPSHPPDPQDGQAAPQVLRELHPQGLGRAGGV